MPRKIDWVLNKFFPQKTAQMPSIRLLRIYAIENYYDLFDYLYLS